MIARGWREGIWGVTANERVSISFRGDENVMESDNGDGCITL